MINSPNSTKGCLMWLVAGENIAFNFASRLPACGVNCLESFGAVWSGGRKNDGGWGEYERGVERIDVPKRRDTVR